MHGIHCRRIRNKDSKFDILIFLGALKERYREARSATNGLPFDPTRHFAGSVSINDMPRYQTGFLRKPSPPDEFDEELKVVELRFD